jgi:hypothetical protein
MERDRSRDPDPENFHESVGVLWPDPAEEPNKEPIHDHAKTPLDDEEDRRWR